MKQPVLMLVVIFLLTSCISSSRMVEHNDKFKEIKGVKLIQYVMARSADKAATISGHYYYSVSAIYILEIKKSEPPLLTLDVQFRTPIRTDNLDSVMFFSLDDEKIRIVSNEYKSIRYGRSSTSSTSIASTNNNETNNAKTQTTENGRNRLISRQFTVPESLWVSIAYSEKIQYRFYLGKEGFEVKLNLAETNKLKEFFNRAMQMRDANLPPIPEGQKIW
jgi:hypothetical protein